MLQPAMTLSQLMLQQAATQASLLAGSGYVSPVQPLSATQAVLGSDVHSPGGTSPGDFPSWNRSGSASKILCPAFTTSLGMASAPSSSPTASAPTSSPPPPPPTGDFMCNNQADLYSTGCLSDLTSRTSMSCDMQLDDSS